jgi:polyhydroxyalkanoate synthesis regulator phasin
MATAENDLETVQSVEAGSHGASAEATDAANNGAAAAADEPAGTNEDSGWSNRFTKAWRDTVGAYATDEGETRNLLGRLVDFGALSKDEAGRAFLQMRERIDENRRVLDRRVDETLEQTISKLPFPTPGELQKLRDRVKELESRLDQLERS